MLSLGGGDNTHETIDRLFEEAEELARLLLDLKTEESRLHDSLEQIWEARWIAMLNIEQKARNATNAHSEECAARSEREAKKRKHQRQ